MTDNHLETFRGVVCAWHCDHQGHMTVQHYVAMFDQAFWQHLALLGFNRSYLAGHRTGFVDVRGTYEYLAEQTVGAPLVIRSGLSNIGTTSVTGFHEMSSVEDGDVCARAEIVSVYFDLERREKSRLPDPLRPALEANRVASD